MRKFSSTIIIMLMGVAFSLSAGDAYQFVNLGFSRDNKTFSFAQYGFNEESKQSEAEFFFIDIAKNRYVKDGVQKYSSNIIPNAGQSSRGILYNGLRALNGKYTGYKIDHLNTGRLLFVSLKDKREFVSFRDFESGESYSLILDKKDKAMSTSFIISLERKLSSGKTIKYNVGNPDIWRKDVKDYQIESILLSPDEKSMIIVLAKIYSGMNSDPKIRYMVETLVL